MRNEAVGVTYSLNENSEDKTEFFFKYYENSEDKSERKKMYIFVTDLVLLGLDMY